MPSLNPPRPPYPAALPQRLAVAWVVGFVLLCLFVQALLVPAQRISERSHFHASSSAAGRSDGPIPAAPASAAPRGGQRVVRVLFEHHATVKDQEAPHHHSGLQDHDHGERADVVYVSPDDSPSKASLAPSSKRVLLDQDGLWAGLLPRVVIACALVVFTKATLLLRTRTELPLDRPPR